MYVFLHKRTTISLIITVYEYVVFPVYIEIPSVIMLNMPRNSEYTISVCGNFNIFFFHFCQITS